MKVKTHQILCLFLITLQTEVICDFYHLFSCVCLLLAQYSVFEYWSRDGKSTIFAVNKVSSVNFIGTLAWNIQK